MSEQQPWYPHYGPTQQGRSGQAPGPQDPPGAYIPPSPGFQNGTWPNQPMDTAQQQDAYPYTPAAPRPGPPRRKKPPAALLIGCAAALVIAGAGWALTGGGSPASTTASGPAAHGSLKTVWAAGGTAGVKLQSFAATWATSDLIIDARVDGVIGYALPTGAEAWGWQTPSGDATCAMSTAVSNGIGVIAYGNPGGGNDAATCDHLVALNAETGKVLWTRDLDPPLSSKVISPIKVTDPHIAVAGDTVAVEAEDLTVQVDDLATGKVRWSSPDEVANLDDTSNCNPLGVQIAASTVYELTSCLSSSGAGISVALQAYPAHANSAPTPTSLQVPGISGDGAPELWSAGNYLFAVAGGGIGAGTVDAYDVGAGSTTPTTLNLGAYASDVFETSLDGQLNPRGWAVEGNTFYVEDRAGQGGHAGVAALDLTTGKQLWNQVLGGDTESTIIDAAGSGVEVVTHTDGQTGYELVRLAAADGAASYGPGTPDQRFFINEGNSTLYIEGQFLVNVEVMTVGNTPGVVVLSGARQ